jgi:single-stranded DNA-binding protein
MGDMNYIGGVVRILEIPTLKINKNEIPFTNFRVQLSQLRSKQSKTTLKVLAWGNLAEDVVKYYRVDDYVLIEGYLSVRKSITEKDNKNQFLQVNVFKIFPLFLNTKLTK